MARPKAEAQATRHMPPVATTIGSDNRRAATNNIEERSAKQQQLIRLMTLVMD